MSKDSGALLGSLGVVFASYLLAARVRAGKGGRLKLHPLQMSQGLFGPDLASFQVLFFTFIVFWASAYVALRHGTLAEIDPSVLALLGINVAGAAGAKLADTLRCRLSLENWAWLKEKKWYEGDYIIKKRDPKPTFTNLLMSGHRFEIERFQALLFSVIVGFVIALSAYRGQALGRSVPTFYLYLMGISQGVYVVNKLVSPATINELDTKLRQVRELEASFMLAVCKSPSWDDALPAERKRELAKRLAPAEYSAFMQAAGEAAVMIHNLTDEKISAGQMEPGIPGVAITPG